MVECLSVLSQPTQLWFTQTFGEPTQAQQLAWPAIHAGNNVLVIAPTGSGKTLAAFLSAIDRIVTEKIAQSQQGARVKGRRRTKNKGVRVLYISPLKALGVDVAKNLDVPLHGIRQAYEALGERVPDVSVAIRTGDTSPQERRIIVSHPPDILVTTPESLYLLLTSKARTILDTVETVIVDEIHAMVGTKRGAHLALSLERLDARLAKPAQRIGLSATVNPVEQVATFLGGNQHVVIAQSDDRPQLDLRIVEPAATMNDGKSESTVRSNTPSFGAITGVTPAMQRLAARNARASATTEQHVTTQSHAVPQFNIEEPTDQVNASVWPQIQADVLDQVLAHHTTLIFVNSRGLAERFTAQLNDLYMKRQGKEKPTDAEPAHYRSSFGSTSQLVGSVPQDEAIAMAHHGSVSKDRRKQIESQLKQGRLRCVVATSSLELGIDMGSVDLVIQIAPPLSIASGLQRVGRADHRVGGTSHALIYPVTREQIIGAAASVESMLAGAIEPLHMPVSPLDVLAQQTVAAASLEPIRVDDWFATVRKSAPYMQLQRDMFDAVIGMITGAYNGEEFSAFKPPLVFDETTGMIAGRPGAQRLAVTSGGTIPDRGLYTVVLPESEAGTGPRRVGELDEEMVYESRVGDVITLGTTTWQIQEITNDRVIVLPAPGRSARLPFWHGEGDGRAYQFGLAQGQWLADVERGLIGAAQTHPDAQDAPRARFTDTIVARLQADGCDDYAIDNLAQFIAAQRAATGAVPTASRIVIEQCRDEEGDWRFIIHSPFGKRVHEPWALAINARLMQRYGIDGQIFAADDGIVVRVPDGDGNINMAQVIAIDPDAVTRIIEAQVSSSVLFASRFRECAARALFMPRTDPSKRVPLWQQRLRAAQLLTAARNHKNFPLLLETARECLQDVYDVPALREVLTRLQAHHIDIHEAQTNTPSPMADQLLFGFVGSVMYQYDVPQAERNAQLLSIDPLVLERLLGTDDFASILDHDVIDTVGQQLATHTFWNELADDDIDGRIHRYVQTHTPFTADQMIADLQIDAQRAVARLNELHAAGELLTGRFDDRLPDDVAQWVHTDVFRRIRSQSLARARKAVQPVEPAIYQQFVCERQGVGSVGGERYEGIEGVMRVIEQLEGIALPLHVWEHAVFPIRVRDYQSSMLDELVASGEALWVGSGSEQSTERVSAIAWYPSDSVQLQAHCAQFESHTAPSDEPQDETTPAISMESAIIQVLEQGGAYPITQLEDHAHKVWQQHPESMIDTGTGELVEVAWSTTLFEEALWRLVRQGRITNSTCSVLRQVTQPTRTTRTSSLRRHRARMITPQPRAASGLWSLVQSRTEPCTSEERAIDLIDVLLDRYGIIAKPIIEQAGITGGFSALYPVLRRMEEQGILARGMFVKGFGAAQFAQRDTVDILREYERDHTAAQTVALDTTDPANLYGGALAWPEPIVMQATQSAADQSSTTPVQLPSPSKPIRKSGSLVVMRHGHALLYLATRTGKMVLYSDVHTVQQQACQALADALHRDVGGSITITSCNGIAMTHRMPIMQSLRAAGFAPSPQGMKLYR